MANGITVPLISQSENFKIVSASDFLLSHINKHILSILFSNFLKNPTLSISNVTAIHQPLTSYLYYCHHLLSPCHVPSYLPFSGTRIIKTDMFTSLTHLKNFKQVPTHYRGPWHSSSPQWSPKQPSPIILPNSINNAKNPLTSTPLTMLWPQNGMLFPILICLGKCYHLYKSHLTHLQEEPFSFLCSTEFSTIQLINHKVLQNLLPKYIQIWLYSHLCKTALVQALIISHSARCNNLPATNFTLLKSFLHTANYCGSTFKKKKKKQSPSVSCFRLPFPTPSSQLSLWFENPRLLYLLTHTHALSSLCPFLQDIKKFSPVFLWATSFTHLPGLDYFPVSRFSSDVTS